MKKINLLLFGFVLFAFVLFFVGSPDIVPMRSFKIAWNLGHVVFFAIATFLLIKHTSFLEQTTPVRQFCWVVGLCLVASLLIEAIQFAIGRQADWQDILRNILGCMSALVFFPRSKSYCSIFFGIPSKIVIIALLCLQLYPLLVTLVDEQLSRSKFPILADFENKLELSRWTSNGRITLDKKLSSHGDFSARIELTTDQYSGASLKFFPANWKGFERLLFSIYLPENPPLPIITRIHDQQHEQGNYLHSDRFNQKTILQAGWNHIAINISDIIQAPQTRAMDIESVANIHFFTINLKQPRVIYLDNLRLE